jgi:CO dehydrogenase/acetyl-CoA synthase delta subunit
MVWGHASLRSSLWMSVGRAVLVCSGLELFMALVSWFDPSL